MTNPASEDRSAIDWEQRFLDDDAPWERAGVHPAFEGWRAEGLFKPGLRVYAPGCGRSAEPEAFARLGLEVTATDLSPTAVSWQRARFAETGLNGVFLEADGLSWRPEAPFDLLYEQTFLCAIHPHKRDAYADMAHAVLKPGGRLLALFMQKQERGGPPYGCDLSDMRALFPDARWRWPQGDLIAYPHPSLGGKAELAAVLSRR